MASGGYTVKLAPGTRVPDSYYCPHCKLLLRNAVQTSEGDRLCELCFKTIAKMPGHVCEDCGINVDPKEFYPDIASRKEISKVTVLCHNSDQGCSWSGLLKDINTHLEECGFKKLKCDLCHEGVLARYLKQHMANECPERTINCGYCSASVISKDLQTHYGVCKNYPEDCPYCTKRVPRSEMDRHLTNECTHTRCSCGDVVIRELRGDHLKDRNVLFDHLAKPVPAMDQSDAVIVMQETLKQHTSELVDCREELRVVNHRLDKVETEQSRQAAVLETGSAVGQSDPPAGKDVQQQLHVIQQQVQKLMERLQLLEERRNYDLPPLSQEGEDKFGGGGMSVHAKLKFLEEKILDVEKTANILSVHHSELELQLQASLASSFNGTFVWRIPDVPRRIREAKSGRVSSIYSPPFYTGRTGYKMCIRAYLNGDGIGENSHLSLFFVIMKGEYDPLLGWPFDHKVSLIVIDQERNKHLVQTFKPNSSSSSFQQPRGDMNVASGCPQFCALSVLADASYVKDDVMFIKAIVDVTKISHP